MRVVDISEAELHLLRLVEEAARGELFVIAKAGRPMVKVVPLGPEEAAAHWLGFMRDADWRIPDDFDTMD